MTDLVDNMLSSMHQWLDNALMEYNKLLKTKGFISKETADLSKWLRENKNVIGIAGVIPLSIDDPSLVLGFSETLLKSLAPYLVFVDWQTDIAVNKSAAYERMVRELLVSYVTFWYSSYRIVLSGEDNDHGS